MKAAPALLSLSLLLFSTLCPALELPRGDMYVPGSSAERKALPAAEYAGHLLPAMQDYLFCLRHHAQGRAILPSELTTYRHAAMDAAHRFSAEVNDLLQRPDGSWATPLSLAVQAQDAELVRLLLQLGALPFTPSAAHSLEELPLLEGMAPDPKVNEHLLKAKQRFNPLATLLARQSRPPQNAAGRLLQELEESNEHTYLTVPGEEKPWQFYLAFRRLPYGKGSLLRVQPISRTIVQPWENREKGGGLYGAIITTARVEAALTGERPDCELVTWEIRHEGPITESSPLLQDEPIFFTLSPRMIEESTLGSKHYRLRNIDGFDLFRGAHWQGIFERVLADFPEKTERQPATAEELAAAWHLMEESPIVLRATISRSIIKLDEEAGLVHVRFLASPRDPLKGALIKGSLRDWGNILYERSFPLSDEWRQQLAEGKGNHLNIPVILCLDEAGEGEESCWAARNARSRLKVTQAFDARHDAAMLRALNEAAFRPAAAQKAAHAGEQPEPATPN